MSDLRRRLLIFYFKDGFERAVQADVPVARPPARGFSAEKRIHPPPPCRSKVRSAQVSHPLGGRLLLCFLAPPFPTKPGGRLCGGPGLASCISLAAAFLKPPLAHCAAAPFPTRPASLGSRGGPMEQRSLLLSPQSLGGGYAGAPVWQAAYRLRRLFKAAARSLRCGSFPHATRFAGLARGPNGAKIAPPFPTKPGAAWARPFWEARGRGVCAGR